MITVIADDITGGAEIAGIGWRYGLSAELSTRSDIAAPEVGLWVISTDTRSMKREEAVRMIVSTVRNLRKTGIKEIFKKTDSALRGHIVAELSAQLREEGKKQVILCPANPRSGRKIINGKYLINGIPIHETGFSVDPEFPVHTSDVREILHLDSWNEPGITIANAESEEDLHIAVRLKNEETLLAGSAAFFTAYLESLGLIPSTSGISFPSMKNAFYVRGSAYDKSRKEVEDAAKNGANVVYLSPLVNGNPESGKITTEYASGLISALNRGEKAVLAIGHPVLPGKAEAEKIKDLMADVVKEVISETEINELVIEGGATASSIFGKLNFSRFIPTHEYVAGVVRMKIKEQENLFVTIKPGSYTFPEEVWNFKTK